MAIQVGGTTVIDNTPNLVNVGGLKTINGTSILGSGNISAGASTTEGAVGTYLACGSASTSNVSYGGTISGSNLKLNNANAISPFGQSSFSYYTYAAASTAISGTWRLMGGHVNATASSQYFTALWVRIS
jgi:hypothetical protein